MRYQERIRSLVIFVTITLANSITFNVLSAETQCVRIVTIKWGLMPHVCIAAMRNPFIGLVICYVYHQCQFANHQQSNVGGWVHLIVFEHVKISIRVGE